MSKYGENTVRFIDGMISEGVSDAILEYFSTEKLEKIEDDEIRKMALKVASVKREYLELCRIATMVEDGEDPRYPDEG